MFQIGPRATIPDWNLVVTVIALMIALLAYLVVASRPVGWWEGSFKEGGSGSLWASN